MKTVGSFFVNNFLDCVSIKDNIVSGKNYRFTILSERLIRLEYSKNGKFVDLPSERVIFRKFPKVNFNLVQSELLIQITTTYFTLSYVKEKGFDGGKMNMGGNLKIDLNQTDHSWYYHHPEARNFGGIPYSLDNFSGSLKLDKGMYSTDGFAVLDDSDSFLILENGNYQKRDDGSIDLYVFMYRKDLGLCLQDYYTLCGAPMLISRYALGVWWYKNEKYTNQEIEKLIVKFYNEGLPISVFMLGSGFHDGLDPVNFDKSVLNVVALRQFLNRYQVRLGVSVDPSIAVSRDTETYSNIQSVLKDVSGNYSFLPLNNTSLNMYASYGIRNLLGCGVDTFLIDYRNVKDKNTLAIMNHYFYAMSDMLLHKRGVVMGRYHGMAMHRDGIVFTGDTRVDWNTLATLPRYFSTSSNNGLSYVSAAIGGFRGGIENFELYIRYIQLGVFSSMLVLSSDAGKYYRREPWRWNVAEKSIIMKYLKLRNQLIPYLYSEAYTYSKYGSPMIQPLYYKYPKIYDEPLYKNQYFFGSLMLVCPITKKKNPVMNRVVQRMFLPEGIWYELESGKKYLGNKYYMSFYRDEDYPVFVRSGGIVVQSLDSGVLNPVNLLVDVFPGSNGEYKLYEDDGVSNLYLNGDFSITEFSYQYQLDHYELSIQTVSNPGLVPGVRNFKVRFRNAKMCDVSIYLGQNLVEGAVRVVLNDLVVDVSNVPSGEKLKIVCSGGILESSMVRLINDDIRDILEDLEIETVLKEKLDTVLFGDLPIKKKRIAIRKLKRSKLEPKFIKMFLNLLEYIETV